MLSSRPMTMAANGFRDRIDVRARFDLHDSVRSTHGSGGPAFDPRIGALQPGAWRFAMVPVLKT